MSYRDLETEVVEGHNGTVRDLEIGESEGDSYWVKKGLTESEIYANLTSNALFENTSLEGPRSTYDESEQALIVEDLGEITLNHELDEDKLRSYNPEAESIIASTAVKALIGDRDTEKNIAYCHDSGKFRAFDFDKGGNRISSSFESAVNTAEELVEASGYSSDKERLREGLAKYMREIAQQADLEGMSEQLEDNPHGKQVLQNFETAMNYESGEDPRYHFLETWDTGVESQESFAL